jgi:pyrroline-5-carboxylate reductase
MRPEGTGEMAEGTRLRIGFLGAGRMATALARGWLTASLVRPGDLRASDPVPSARQSFATEVDCLAIAENAPVVEASDLLVLAVKPQSMPGLLPEIRPLLRSQLVVSIAAGISLSQLHKGLGEGCRLVRIMPNTPCLVGASASAYSPSTTATADDAALVDRLMNAVGKAYRVPEALLDAVTGLSGSGPAYVYVIVEALADGGVRGAAGARTRRPARCPYRCCRVGSTTGHRIRKNLKPLSRPSPYREIFTNHDSTP